MIHTDGTPTIANRVRTYRPRAVGKMRTNDLGRKNGGHYDPARARKYDLKLVRTPIPGSNETVIEWHAPVGANADES